MNIFDVTIIGVGRLGGALALALSKKGYQVKELVSRDFEKAKRIADLIEPKPRILKPDEFDKISSSVIFITTQDDEIPIVAENLAEKLEDLPYVFHTSGSLSSDVLQKLNNEGCEVASFHPLVSISDSINGANSFANAYFCIEGDSEAVIVGKQIANDLHGNPFTIEAKYKTLYHASAVMACGHLVSLISIAIDMLAICGLQKNEAQEILMPLIKSTVTNLSTQTPSSALTGTFARADAGILRKHLETLRENVSTEALEIYLKLGGQSLELARQNGVSEQSIELMKEILNESELICV